MTQEQIIKGERLIDDVIAHNKNAIIAAMKDAGLVTVEATYSGSGGSGNGYEIGSTPQNREAMERAVEIQTINREYDRDAHVWIETVRIKSVDLAEAIRDLCENLISAAGHDGFQDGDGGGGTMTIVADTGFCELAHYDYVVDTVHDYHEF
jgi:hypothetical protein